MKTRMLIKRNGKIKRKLEYQNPTKRVVNKTPKCTYLNEDSLLAVTYLKLELYEKMEKVNGCIGLE